MLRSLPLFQLFPLIDRDSTTIPRQLEMNLAADSVSLAATHLDLGGYILCFPTLPMQRRLNQPRIHKVVLILD